MYALFVWVVLCCGSQIFNSPLREVGSMFAPHESRQVCNGFDQQCSHCMTSAYILSAFSRFQFYNILQIMYSCYLLLHNKLPQT